MSKVNFPSNEKLAALAAEKSYISTSDIQALFNSSSQYARKRKHEVEQKMAENGVRPAVHLHVPLDWAYRTWGIDMKLVEKALILKQKLNV